MRRLKYFLFVFGLFVFFTTYNAVMPIIKSSMEKTLTELLLAGQVLEALITAIFFATTAGLTIAAARIFFIMIGEPPTVTVSTIGQKLTVTVKNRMDSRLIDAKCIVSFYEGLKGEQHICTLKKEVAALPMRNFRALTSFSFDVSRIPMDCVTIAEASFSYVNSFSGVRHVINAPRTDEFITRLRDAQSHGTRPPNTESASETLPPIGAPSNCEPGPAASEPSTQTPAF